MPAPTNISALTATDLGTLPASVTQTVDFSGTTYTVWYKFTAPTGCNEVYALAFGDLTVYTPTIEPYDGPAAAPVAILSIAAQNKPCQFPVTAGTEYFLEVVKNGTVSPAVLHLTVTAHTQAIAALGSILVPDANQGFPAAIISSTANYTVSRYVQPFSSSEAGDVLETGQSLALGGAGNDELTVRNSQLSTVATLTAAGTGTVIRTCQGLGYWFTGTPNVAGALQVRTVTSAGAFGATTWTIPSITTLGGMAASNTGGLLYYAKTATNEAIRVWNLVTNMAASDFVAGIAAHRIVDILVLRDNTLIVSYFKGTATTAFVVKHYDTDATVLRTYSIATGIDTVIPRLAYAIDDPNSFWAWYAFPVASVTAGSGTSQFLNIKVSDGSILTTRTHMSYGAGSWAGLPIASPPGTFGHDNSCPFWIIRAPIGGTTTTYTIRRQRRFLLPSSPDNKTMQIPTLELLMRTGIGLTPGAASDPPIQGSDPQVMMRISKDGGKTWLPERWASAGTQGNYKDRVRWLRATGNYRNAVCEVTVSDPCDWQWLAMLGSPVEGSS